MTVVKIVCLLLLAAHVALCCRKYDLSQIRVEGNQFVNVYNEPVILRGLNYGSSESECVKGTRKVFDGPQSLKNLLLQFNRWEANAIRIHLNEYCWLDTTGRTSRRPNRGMQYREHIELLTRNLTRAGYVVILDLYWSEPGLNMQANGQTPMPNTENSVRFWTSVAEMFKDDKKVFFELFSEPYPDNEQLNEGWQCLHDGGSCNGVPFQAVGMQALVDAIRQNAEATNVVLIGGLAKSNSLTQQWIDYKPDDPLNNIAAAWHSTSSSNCNTESCWDSTVGVVKEDYPVVTTAFGETGPAGSYVTPLMDWMDKKNISYFALTYNDPEYAGEFALIENYSGGGRNPTNYGQVIKDHLIEVTRNIRMP